MSCIEPLRRHSPSIRLTTPWLRLARVRRSVLAQLAAARGQLPLDQGPGGPLLVIANPANPFGRYYAEILRTEGLNAFAVADIGDVTSATLSNYDVAVLAETPLTAAQVTMLSNWVTAGGN